MTLQVLPRVVAIVPAFNNAEDIASTILSLQNTEIFDAIVVVDDASVDDTIACARPMGVTIVSHPHNAGKGAALATGVAMEPEADVYVFVDADTSTTAGQVSALVDPILLMESDLTIATLPSAGKRGGFGLVRKLARRQIHRATGLSMQSPLSGQRAIRGSLARSLSYAHRYGAEVAMTIDAYRLGAHVREIPIEMEHDHRGRSFRGFIHRARQGIDVQRATWPRVTSRGFRFAITSIVAWYLLGGLILGGFASRPASEPRQGRVNHVVLFSMPTLSLSDMSSDLLPNLRSLVANGSVAAMSARTIDKNPNEAEAYATIGAGSPVPASSVDARAFNGTEIFQGSVASDVIRQRTGEQHAASVVVPGVVALRKAADNKSASSLPGSLGDALHEVGYHSMVIGNADYYDANGSSVINRTIATTVMDSNGSIDLGSVGNELLEPKSGAPFEIQANNSAIVSLYESQQDQAAVIAVDSGDLSRTEEAIKTVTPAVAENMRQSALEHTDELLGSLVANAAPRTLFIVTSPFAHGTQQQLVPTVMSGPGVFSGHLFSTSTQTDQLITITDLAPSILDAININPSSSLIGHSLRLQPGDTSLAAMQKLQSTSTNRDHTYKPLAYAFIIYQAIMYLVVALSTRKKMIGNLTSRRMISAGVLSIAAYLLATFVVMLLPFASDLTAGTYVLALVATSLAITGIATLVTENTLSALRLVSGATVALLLIDIARGGHLALGGLLTNSPFSAARFHGFGNIPFTILACSTILWSVLHVKMSPRPREAIFTAAALFFLVFVADGMPTLGADIGGVVTLVPIFAVLVWYLLGHSVKIKTLLVAGALTAVAIGAFAAFDLSRPLENQTHIARFAHSILHNDSSSSHRTVVRKIRANINSFKSPWAWTVPVVALFLLSLFAGQRSFRSLFPERSSDRAGLMALIAVGVLGYLVNDSGVVVTAIAAVYCGTFVALLALHGEGEELVLAPNVVLRSVRLSNQPKEVLL